MLQVHIFTSSHIHIFTSLGDLCFCNTADDWFPWLQGALWVAGRPRPLQWLRVRQLQVCETFTMPHSSNRPQPSMWSCSALRHDIYLLGTTCSNFRALIGRRISSCVHVAAAVSSAAPPPRRRLRPPRSGNSRRLPQRRSRRQPAECPPQSQPPAARYIWQQADIRLAASDGSCLLAANLLQAVVYHCRVMASSCGTHVYRAQHLFIQSVDSHAAGWAHGPQGGVRGQQARRYHQVPAKARAAQLRQEGPPQFSQLQFSRHDDASLLQGNAVDTAAPLFFTKSRSAVACTLHAAMFAYCAVVNYHRCDM